MSRLNAYKGFAAVDDNSNWTLGGQAHLEMAENLHDILSNWPGARLGRGAYLPVGSTPVAVGPPGTGLPELVPGPPTTAPRTPPPAIDRRDIPPLQEVVPVSLLPGQPEYVNWGGPDPDVPTFTPPVLEATTEAQYAKLKALYPNNTVVMTGLQQPMEQQPVSVLGDIYDVIDTGLGGVLPGGVPLGTTPAQQVYQTFSSPVPASSTPALPQVQMTTPAPKHQCYKLVNGQWVPVRKYRKRRKRLATATDIADLAKLKGVLGQGKAMSEWIATHS